MPVKVYGQLQKNHSMQPDMFPEKKLKVTDDSPVGKVLPLATVILIYYKKKKKKVFILSMSIQSGISNHLVVAAIILQGIIYFFFVFFCLFVFHLAQI